MVLLRRVIGDALRARRQGQHRTLREVSSAANVSLGYLSEIERGQKEASSELLAAICDALGARLSELLRDVSDTVELAEEIPNVLVPVPDRGAAERLPAGRTGGDATRPERAPAPSTRPEPVRRSAPAEPARQPAHAEAPASRPAMADAVLRPLAEGGKRQRPVDGNLSVATDGRVSVTVRQQSPLKTTLRTTRRIRPKNEERDVVCVG
ncbi:helix-turn-helix domain-containing protein [Plantactinospora sp. CA-290183]|uniref:helix-turn-helix domain-containing protein n=1 Tax=Plantactinospora sp. CA-290183 TaxID=3240006 RepID=UPI003D8DD12F